MHCGSSHYRKWVLCRAPLQHGKGDKIHGNGIAVRRRTAKTARQCHLRQSSLCRASRQECTAVPLPCKVVFAVRRKDFAMAGSFAVSGRRCRVVALCRAPQRLCRAWWLCRAASLPCANLPSLPCAGRPARTAKTLAADPGSTAGGHVDPLPCTVSCRTTKSPLPCIVSCRTAKFWVMAAH
jgi:hypothetical protein